MSTRTIGRAVGALFLLAFVAYLTGDALIASAREAGALVMLVNSACVAGIAALVFPILRRHHEISACAYAIGRTVEAVLLAVGTVFLLTLTPQGNTYAYQIAMISGAAAGLVFCRVLLQERLAPRFMAIWGLLGYAVLLVGAMLEVLGYPVGLVLSVPGGLFEIALGALLVAKGFPQQHQSPGHQVPRTTAVH